MKDSTRSPKKRKVALKKFDPACAGLDIGSREIYACIAKSSTKQEVRAFQTFTDDLRQMVGWLKANGVQSVAMESTGVYWIVAYDMLEAAGFEVLLCNACAFKAVPGRKTDVQDCQWIQQLHSHGLLRGSFRPTQEIVELRTFVRQRTSLFDRAATHKQIMIKAMTQMNILLNTVIRDLTGVTGTNIVEAILNGERDPQVLAELSVGLCRKNIDSIAKSLEGYYRDDHLFELRQAYEAYTFFHKQIVECEKEIELRLSKIDLKEVIPESMVEADGNQSDASQEGKKRKKKKNAKKMTSKKSPYCFDAATVAQGIFGVDLTAIPGIDANSVIKLLAEIGTDMSRWPSSKAFCAWLAICPGNKVSGGKILSSRTKPSNNRAAQALRMAAMSLFKAQSALGAYARRMKSRLGSPKAITAVAHKLARIIYAMLSTGKSYYELGEDYYEQQYRARCVERLQKQAKNLGYALTPTVVE